MKYNYYRLSFHAILVGVFLFPGCSSEPKQYAVTGEVRYLGQPVARGEIVFADANGAGAAAVGKIKDGRYRICMLPGEKKVRITAAKETGKMIEGAMGVKYPERVDLIPPKYNSATTLVLTVEPDGDGVFDFRLE